jgi:hypothetical protein
VADEQIPPGFEFLASRFDRAVGELRTELRSEIRELRTEMRAAAEQNERRWEQAEQRFEVIATALRDMSEQLAMHSRALNTLLSRRPEDAEWRESIERRVQALEQRGH